MSGPSTPVAEDCQLNLEQRQSTIQPSVSSPATNSLVARRWYFTDIPGQLGTTEPVEPLALRTGDKNVWTSKASLAGITPGWYWIVFCVSFETLNLDHLSTLLFDVKRGNATDHLSLMKHTCETRIGTSEIEKNLKVKVREGGRIVRLRLHRQIEVTKATEYLHLTIGAKIRDNLQDVMFPQSFDLQYVELGTSSFKSTDGLDDYVLYGVGRPHQMITVDRIPEAGEEKPAATEIRTYGISESAEFAVTLHLKEVCIPRNSHSSRVTEATTITIDAPAQRSIAAAVSRASNATLLTILSNANPTRICAVISVWDLRSKNNIDADVSHLAAWDTLSYLKPCAEIEYDLPKPLGILGAWDKFHACVSISTKGTKVVIGGIEETYDALPFTVFDCTYQGEVDVIGADRRLEKETRRPCKDLKEFSGYGIFHRVDPTKFDINDDNDNERFVVFNGLALEVYSTRNSGWERLQQITLSPGSELRRANCYAIMQSLRGRYFAWTGDPGVVSIWDMEKGKLMCNIFIETDKSPIYAVLSPDGTKVAISVKKTVQIYETPTGILLGTYDKGLRLDNNSEVVLGNEYFVVRDESLTPSGEPTRARSVVRIKDMKVIKSYSLHEDYHIRYPMASLTRIAAYTQGSVLNIRRMKGIETPKMQLLCGRRLCDPKEVVIEDFIDKRPFKFTSEEGEVFHGKCYREYHNGCWNMMLKITFNVDLHDPSTDSTPTSKSMVLPLGDMTANFQGFYLPTPSKLVIFAEGYMKIWTLSSTEAQICQLDYIWGSLFYEPDHTADYCYRPLVKAWACPHGTSMRFYLKKPVWYKNHIVVSGDPESEEYDILTVPPQQKDETVDTEETERLQCGIFSLIDIYGFGDSNCKDDIVRYLLTCIRPSNTNKTSCLVPLCEAWSTKNQEYLTELVSAILPKKRITWIPDSKPKTTLDPLAILLKKAGKQQSVLGLVKVVMGYCIAQATQHTNLAFLSPIFASMDKITKHYPEEALKCMGRIAYIPVKHPAYIWKNNIACRKVAPLRFPVIEMIRRIVMTDEAKKRWMLRDPIMHFKYKMNKTVQDVEDNDERPVFMASFDALLPYAERSSKKKSEENKNTNKDTNSLREDERRAGGSESGSREKGGTSKGRRFAGIIMGKKGWQSEADANQGEGNAENTNEGHSPQDCDLFGEPLVVKKTTWWKVLFHAFRSRLYLVYPTVKCHDFDLEFFANPAIDALVTYKCRLYGVFIAIIAMGFIFIILEILQLIQNWKRYLESHYNFVDIVTFVLPPIASGMQLYFIRSQDMSANNRALSFSVLVVFFHMLIELRISKGVCKYVTIIQQAMVEIWIFFMIFAGCIVAFTITLLHLRRSCAYEGCTRGPTEYPRNFLGALSATYFFLGGRYDPVRLELDANVDEDWAFHIAMFIFLFLTTILMLNVLIALINVAFTKGGDGWRKAWVEARLRYIESAENLSYRIPEFRQAYAEWFPKEIYFTTTAKEVNIYKEKYPRGRRQDDIRALIDDWNKSDDENEDKDKDEDKGKGKERAQEEMEPRPSRVSALRLDTPSSNNQYIGDFSAEDLPPSHGGTLQMPTDKENKQVSAGSLFPGANSGDGAGTTKGIGGERRGEDLGASETQDPRSTGRDSRPDYSFIQPRAGMAAGSGFNKPSEPIVKKKEESEVSEGNIDMGVVMAILLKLDAQMNKMDSVVQRVNLIEERVEALTAHLQHPLPPLPSTHPLSLSDNSVLHDSST
ncbi:hypothetical protein EC991_004372 [Linnemannia zychae]|nr:hypothetical protein EC991_004372 [Linnemannia zychae]